MMRRWVWLLVPLLGACGDDVDDDQVIGELGNGTFRYVCVGTSDPICRDGTSAEDFPERVGVDGVFDLEFAPLEEDDLEHTSIESAADDIVDARNDRFYANGTGTVALLAKRTTNGRVLDLVHLSVVPVARIELDSDGLAPSLVYTVGQRERLAATAVDDDGASVAGARDFTWSVSDERVLRLASSSPTATMDIMPLRAGDAIVEVTTGNVSERLYVMVQGSAVMDGGGIDLDAGTPDGGPVPSDASTDAGDAGLRVPEAGSSDAGQISTADAGDTADGSVAADAAAAGDGG